MMPRFPKPKASLPRAAHAHAHVHPRRTTHFRKLRWVGSALLGIGLLSGCATQSPAPSLWDRWTAHDERERRPVDVRVWQEFLARYVTTQGDGVERVAYARVSEDDQLRLAAWVRLQQQIQPSTLNLREQRAYWLNLYNASIVLIVLDTHASQALNLAPAPRSTWTQVMDSIHDWTHAAWVHARHLWGDHTDSGAAQSATAAEPSGPLAAKRFEIEGQSLSLNDIELHILRPRWLDVRTDYALCRANLDGPALSATPFQAEYLDEQLEARAHAWANNPYAWSIGTDGVLDVSSFYANFAADFAGDAAILSSLRHYAAGAKAAKLAQIQQLRIRKPSTDLNSAAPPS